MSLLVFSSANRIAQGIIRRLYTSGTYERIVAADVFPNYYSMQRFINFKGDLKSVSSNTQISDIQITDRSQLVQAINSVSHILYITHDYYSLVPSKTNLIKLVSDVASKQKNIEKFVALTPVEHDNYKETSPMETARVSEKYAQQTFPDLVLLKSDLTFGADSTLANNVVSSLVNKQFLCPGIKDSVNTKPIHTDNVAEIVERTLKESSHAGKSYLLEGNESISLNNYVSTLKDYTGNRFNSKGTIVNFMDLPVFDLIAERLYSDCCLNQARLFKNYRELSKEEFEGIESFGVTFQNFKSTYAEKTFSEENYKVEGGLEKRIKDFIY